VIRCRSMKGKICMFRILLLPSYRVHSRLCVSAFLPGSSGLTHALNCWLLTAFYVRFHRLRINEKYTIMSPFDITQKLLGPSLFAHTWRETLGDKIELYFQDHSFMPLFVQVGWSSSQPSRLWHVFYSFLLPSSSTAILVSISFLFCCCPPALPSL
jgi:hypothetical protein